MKTSARRVFFEVSKHYPKKGLFVEELSRLQAAGPYRGAVLKGLSGGGYRGGVPEEESPTPLRAEGMGLSIPDR